MLINRHFNSLLLCLVIVFVFFSSCDSGLGPAIDLEAPVLNITSHENLDYEAANFILSGTCSDNISVTRVTVTDTNDGQSLGIASISGNTWSIQLELEEGEQSLRVTAYDKRGNSSLNSAKQLALLIDASDPFINQLEIKRQTGVFSYLEDKTVLEDLSETSFANVDFFQNESFLIIGDVEDNFPLTSVSLAVLDESDNTVLTLDKTSESTNNSPVWEITEDALIAVNSAYATGRHYFRVTVTAVDESSNQNEENTDQFLWFCWYPESDEARIKQSMETLGTITIPKDTSLPLEIYDDDNLDEVYAALLSPVDWSGLTGRNTEDKLEGLISDSNRSVVLGANLQSTVERNAVHTLNSGPVSSEYNLVVLVKDKKSEAAVDAKWSSRMIPVLVTDENAPITVIESPEENTFPNLLPDGESFTINGYTLDNGGATSMLMAWIPAGISGGADAQIDAAITSLVDAADTMSPGDQTTLANGVKIWSYTLGAATDEDINGITYKKRTFSQNFNVLTDFIYSGSLENDRKLLVFLTLDADSNEVSRNFRLYGNNSGPDITINYPASDLQVHSTSDDPMTLSFTVGSASGLAVSSYAIEDYSDILSPVDLSLSGTGNTRTVDITGLTEGRRVYRFTAEDVLGNTSMVQRTVILSELPALQYITSSKLDGTYKAGDTLLIQAVFSSAVRVKDGTPRMRIRYDAADSSDKYADYSSGSGTNTLVFEYVVPDGAEASELHTPDTPIDLNGAAIESTLGTGGNAFLPGIGGIAQLDTADTLQGNKNIALDGIAPVISSFSEDTGSFREGDSVDFTLVLSENVLVAGSPVLHLIGDSPADITADFLSISGDTVVFSRQVEAGDTANPLDFDSDSFFSPADLLLITDLAGNPLSIPASSVNSTSCILDTTAPATPGLSLSSGIYNSNQTLTLGPIESGANAYYSTDGGVSWTSYSAGVPLGNGTYQLTAYQKDAAGNRSANAAVQTVDINGTFPAITGISCQEPDGTYPTGSILHFKVSFAEAVRTTDGTATITLNGAEPDTVDVSVTENATGSTSLDFVWSVPADLDFSPVDITGLNLSGVEDLFGNSPGALTPVFDRPNLKVDSIAPSISSRIPALGGVLDLDGFGNSVIELTFSEPVYAESGLITVRRNGNWLVPPVLSTEEFSEIFYSAALTDTQRGYLMQTETDGSATLDSETGQPVGPYKATTHGLKLEGGYYVPDTGTKYVLDFERDLNDSDLREAFEAAGYHQQVLDVTSFRVDVNSNVITITLPEPLVEGREWEVLLDAGAFRDAAGNLSAAIGDNTYSFWSQNVATPVIRVDRYSHGWGTKEPDASGDLPLDPIGVNDSTAVPTAYVRVRIDCETPGASISYGELNFSNAEVNLTSTSAHVNSTNADPAEANLSGIAIGTSYTMGDYFVVGDGSLTTARKDYIAASATLTGTLDPSESSYEGVFKTLMYYRDPASGRGYTENVRFQGSNIEGGMPTLSGFPVHDNDPDMRYSKTAHNIPATDDWVWISYEFVSSWYAQSVRENWQQGYNDSFYGDFTYTYQRAYW